jgi:hypothetical protein
MKRSLITALLILGVLCSCKKTSKPSSNLIIYSTWKGHVQLNNQDSGTIQFAIGNHPVPYYNTDSLWGMVTTGLYDLGNEGSNQTYQLVGGDVLEGTAAWFEIADPTTGLYQGNNGIEFSGMFSTNLDTLNGSWTDHISGATGTWIAIKQ